jgi:hypothetical protein
MLSIQKPKYPDPDIMPPGGVGAYRGNYQGGNPHQHSGGPSRFDGPSEAPGSPRPTMSPGQHQGSRSGTPGQQGNRSGTPSQNPYPQPLGYDPGRSQQTQSGASITNRRVEYPAAAYQLGRTVSRQFS